jgi:uncharacterized membrane-anchored protein YhcB (DUF1043 family)
MNTNKRLRLERLTALWALNESGLGGFLHIFNTPFTGLIVGGISILMISLIAYFSENKSKSILRALMVVLILKMGVSPHSPIGAYVAVSFQGVLGALLFSKFNWKGLTIPFLAMITYLESAAQKLFILTIVYGNGLWEAIDIYGQWVQAKLQFFTENSTSEILISIYLLTYGICGVLIGFFIKSIIANFSNSNFKNYNIAERSIEISAFQPSKKKIRKFIIMWLATIGLIVLAFVGFGNIGYGWQKGLYILLRSVLILSLWYIIVGPLVLRLVKNYLKTKQSNYEEQVNHTLDILPYLTPVIKYSWQETRNLRGYQRIKAFVALSISNCIHFKI